MTTTFAPWRGILGTLVGALADRFCWPWLGYPFAACRRSAVANGLGRPRSVRALSRGSSAGDRRTRLLVERGIGDTDGAITLQKGGIVDRKRRVVRPQTALGG
jgi:hypothetical protein